MLPGAKLKYDRKYLKKGGQKSWVWVNEVKNKNCCMMFILTANQSCGFPVAISNMLAGKNGKKPSLGISKLRF